MYFQVALLRKIQRETEGEKNNKEQKTASWGSETLDNCSIRNSIDNVLTPTFKIIYQEYML